MGDRLRPHSWPIFLAALLLAFTLAPFLRRLDWAVFDAQSRLLRRTAPLPAPEVVLVGIDEATALVVKGGRATILGEHGVMVFDPSGLKLDKVDGFRNMRIHLLRRGQSLELATRKARP